MSLGTGIDVLLGLASVYLVFALGVTALNEAIAGLANSRAKWLERGIASLVADRPARTATPLTSVTQLADPVLNSPFLAHLSTDSKVGSIVRPSYISATQLLQAALSNANKAADATFESIANISSAAKNLPSDSVLRRVVLDFCAKSEGEMAKFNSMFLGWFNDFEAQITAWYRRRTQLVLWMLSAALVCVLNIDTMAIIKHLSTDEKARAAMVALSRDLLNSDKVKAAADAPSLTKSNAAPPDSPVTGQSGTSDDKAKKEGQSANPSPKQETDAEPLKGSGVANDVSNTNVAAGQAGGNASKPKPIPKLDGSKALSKGGSSENQGESVAVATLKQLQMQDIPLGWKTSTDPNHNESNPTDAYNWLKKILGLLLSSAAISLGAPFWFNVLKTLASLRSVGPSNSERAEKRAKAGATANNDVTLTLKTK